MTNPNPNEPSAPGTRPTRDRITAWAMLAIGLVAVAVGAVWSGLWFWRSRSLDSRIQTILATYQRTQVYRPLTILYPADETLFPPEIPPPTLRWQDGESGSEMWLVTIQFSDGPGEMHFLSPRPEWTPPKATWETIKQRSREKKAQVAILGVTQADPKIIRSCGRISLSTSADAVGAPLFYREVNLPFSDAVRDPSRIRWRFGSIASEQPPPIVLENLPVCGNCHSFSQDGQTLGMDVDYANNKGSYVITRVAQQMALVPKEIITWDDYRREDGQQTFGLLSQVSPDGRYVISTVKDRSVFVPRPELMISQLFFPIQGILAIYRRDTGVFQALPGADDPAYVQSNPTWSPDGQSIVFARAKAYTLRNPAARDKVLLSPEDCEEFLKEGQSYQFDLYRIPFNQGKGGTPEPLAGAAQNGFSNYFPKYSPDGRWIVFCRARNYMLLQPDSELFLIPAAGGEARRLRANTARMNSWHSWSPNGKWLVFSSKANSPYTQLFLTHIDAQGESTPAVLLANMTAPDRAANIPEFVNLPPDAISRIEARFLNDVYHLRAGYALDKSGDVDAAIREYRKALELNPNNAAAHQKLGFLFYNVKRQPQEGMTHTIEALRLDPADAFAHCDLGMALLHQDRNAEAAKQLAEALRLLPKTYDKQYQPAKIRFRLAEALLFNGQAPEAEGHLTQVLQQTPENADAHYALALALAAQGRVDEAEKACTKAVALRSDIDVSPMLHDLLSMHYAKAERWPEARRSGSRAVALARAAGDVESAREIQERLDRYPAANPK